MAARLSLTRVFGATTSSAALTCRRATSQLGSHGSNCGNLALLHHGVRRSFACSATSLSKKFTQDHEWIEIGSDGSTGTIGITKYAANALGDVVYVELPELDRECAAGDTIAAVESVKSASDIMSPVSGKVIEANGALESEPKIINNSPEGDGWICKIQLSDVKEVDSLMDDKAYKAYTEE